ncbi:Rrf2 family transcriptional regulator [Rhizobium sp. NLR22b]|uniref:Rrf2 family transcriptional regulator n=1 Tax=Rhizobium sp. NLR22b TaxID=2731115 RepID=UPI001C8356CE|nr:Rrf2 family transcriptional regulator [Rhizobium sp. NLR22b]MBX5237515.1 Rrf2 family transcriptional regulator [Rhizobium sp. NLR22b]
MRNDSRLSRMLHVLIHMDRHQHAATSEMIAKMLNTNPVVVRRTMAGLRQQGYVRSEKGHGGGWTLVRPLSEITLLDVYNALGEPHVFAIGLADDQPKCLVEQAVNNALADAMKEAEALLLRRLGSVTLEEIAAEFEAKLTARSAAAYSCAS